MDSSEGQAQVPCYQSFSQGHAQVLCYMDSSQGHAQVFFVTWAAHKVRIGALKHIQVLLMIWKGEKGVHSIG